MKKLLRPTAVVAAALIALGSLSACGASNSSPTVQPAASASAATVLPVTSNPMSTTGTKPGLAVTNAIAENNVNPKTKAPVADRLQFDLTNSSASPMKGLDVFYTMKDTSTGKSESYYQKLTGLTLAAGKSQTIYFDNGTGAGHYPENKYSLYRNSSNKVVITILAHATGYKTASGTATKSVGTGEVVGG